MPVRETMLAFLDTETTGLVAGTDEVVEIATILTDLDMREIARFEAKIRTERKPPPEVAAINGWDEAVWAREAVDFGCWMRWLKQRIPFGEVAIPVGANVGFDRAIIADMYYPSHLTPRTFFPLSYRCVDVCALGLVMKLAGPWADIPNCKLVTLAARVGHTHTAHRAMGDVEATMAVYRTVMDGLRQAHLATLAMKEI
jgi:exodeoxyribonuclease-1